MFTTGSKLYFGLTVLAVAALGVLGWATKWQTQATLGAVSVVVAFAFLGGLMLYLRDDETSTAAADAPEPPPAPRHAGWAVAAAFGAALAGIGFAIDTRLFIAGMVVVGVSIVEWSVQSWADRASTDPVYNDRVRGRLMHPLEFPVAGLLGGGLIVFGFSRVMIALSKNGAIVVFAVIGVLVMGLAVLLGTRPRVSRGVVGGVLSVSAIVALVAGVAGIGVGERTFHPQESACGQREEVGSLTVSAKAGLAATISFTGSELVPDSFVGGRNVVLTVIFKNLGDEDVKFVVHAGEEDKLDASGQPVKAADGSSVKVPIEYCTDLVRPDTQAALTMNFIEPGNYDFEAVDEAGASKAKGTVVVP
jgi:hypothetical protein